MASAEASEFTLKATYLNAGIRGSRFMGACDLRCADGEVTLTGRRMPMRLVWMRAFGYVLFAPWFVATFATIGFVAERFEGWGYFLLFTSVLTVYVFGSIGVADLWATYRAPVETVRWRVDQARSVKRTRDSTVSAPGLIPTLIVRAEAGKCILQLRVPVGPNGALRRLTLRARLNEMESLAAAMTGTKTR